MTTLARRLARRPALAGFLVACACVAPAHAGDAVSIRVNYDDLQLATDAGVDALYRRLQYATNAVCEPLRHSRDLRLMREWRACRRSALEEAVKHVGHPGLTRRHEGRGAVG